MTIKPYKQHLVVAHYRRFFQNLEIVRFGEIGILSIDVLRRFCVLCPFDVISQLANVSNNPFKPLQRKKLQHFVKVAAT